MDAVALFVSGVGLRCWMCQAKTHSMMERCIPNPLRGATCSRAIVGTIPGFQRLSFFWHRMRRMECNFASLPRPSSLVGTTTVDASVISSCFVRAPNNVVARRRLPRIVEWNLKLNGPDQKARHNASIHKFAAHTVFGNPCKIIHMVLFDISAGDVPDRPFKYGQFDLGSGHIAGLFCPGKGDAKVTPKGTCTLPFG